MVRAAAKLLEENEDEPTATATTKKKRLSDIKNRRGHLSQAQAPFPKREQADAELTKFLQEDVLDASCDPLMWWQISFVGQVGPKIHLRENV